MGKERRSGPFAIIILLVFGLVTGAVASKQPILLGVYYNALCGRCYFNTWYKREIKISFDYHNRRLVYSSFVTTLADVAKGIQGLSRLRGNSHGLVLRGRGASNGSLLPDF